ncbi:undecaprenyl-phosphate alpha-N-acetylglucosaminyl 1-phosphate transferase [Floricoccus tropicus]|uniref:Undecaprenyl-phosphate alpha-N-acetylglucosaminyl 1-phosphate transferase n=1 Tax=Floricoccus tropicus TaxID=1859473 RepID=A0A1E8GSI0_9LACT|nr:MraY family glycosyltransferase [Floricoccus tropicus]OFI50553.1 undecaprenyl-phosphate alpha-N-acetylglucosaminyl 1-phosphate transferase [Floricoccus tropicus]
MPFVIKYLIVLLITATFSFIITPVVIRLVKKIGAVDKPNARRINKVDMPSAGGLAIFFSFTLSALVFLTYIVGDTKTSKGFLNYFDYVLPLVLSSIIIIITGLIDDIKELSPKWKMFGMIIAAVTIWGFSKFRFDNFKIPFGGPILNFPPWLSLVLTVIWIISITNAVNIIDGLDGLASGVSLISLFTMGIVSYLFLGTVNVFLPITIFVLCAAIIGFLPYNFFPAKIYLGDTGALYLGFMISVLSLQGLKNATAVAVLTPMLILGVPVTDTLVAIIRRKLNNQKVSVADKMHLHHRLLSLGLSHRAAVLVIYGIALIFSLISIILNFSGRVGGTMLIIASIFGLELFLETVGIWGKDRQPLLKMFAKIGNSKK